jgi:dephospho-CoA kinase
MKTVGLTGGIGSGKTLVGRFFRELGAAVIDADQIARDVVAPGADGLRAVVARFGREVLAPDGSLDRDKLAGVVFADPQARRDLEAIVHPLVYFSLRDQSEQHRREGAPLVVLEIPLLFESPSPFAVDATICVIASRETQWRRIRARSGYDDEVIRGILDAQMDPAEKARRADYVIRNDGSPEETRRQVVELYQTLTGR